MTTYAVGDIQGCLEPLKKLLDTVNFDSACDELWAVGDLVNRGPDSLGTLRFLHSLGGAFKTVLGNHDLHLLAVYFKQQSARRKDTFAALLEASDASDLLNWLRQQPLLYENEHFVMVHAGIPVIWSLDKARALANEVHSVLRGNDFCDYLANMYGNEPARWSDDLSGTDRLRVITNYFTRMRLCDENNALELSFKGSPADAPQGQAPWYEAYAGSPPGKQILFGHWAALEGCGPDIGIHALDSGCVWGNCMTLLRLDTLERITCPCDKPN